ncbi:galactose-1-epimerase [Streptacidiphilus pinicola]|uniref:Aldose 1-epimerase n=1 Tax=Streptacidiphilus pinicola TaxID=2219663 RepID=A0A2X0JA13_9ACTN|nr:aldose epimerase family protein [Streptacidiphilus pinicola]RAG84338.1 galactose-1-epimerase [Streptacidiphilus pinicola]
MHVLGEPYAQLPDGRSVERWTFGSPEGVTAQMLTLGATLSALHVPDREGRRANVVLCAIDIRQLVGEARYFGATVGRCANRVRDGRLPVGAVVHRLPRNERGRHTLHGGPDGFDNRLWQARPIQDDDRVGVAFHLHSPHGDQGFPGNLDVTATYTLDADGALSIDYRAVTDAPTVVNLTNHAYFNLAGEGNGDVLDHLLRIEADHYTPVDRELIPLPGPAAPVAGTPFDFTSPRTLGAHIVATDPQLARAGGYDHNWVLRRPANAGGSSRAEGLALAATLWHPASGRRLECLTTEPGLQIYPGNLFDGSVTGPSGRPYPPFAGVALETQHFPDSPNRPDFPTTVLHPGEFYRSTTVYRFTSQLSHPHP